MPTHIEIIQLPLEGPQPRIVFGAGGLHDIAKEVDGLGVSRVMLVGTPGRGGVMAGVSEALGQRVVARFEGAVQHVPVKVVDTACTLAQEHGVDAVLAVGGGSAVGLAKAVALRRDVVVIAVPTTYSGSEMTEIFGITEPDGKRTGRDPRVRPALVLYAPSLSATLPADKAIPSLFNAMAHAVEALYAEGATTSIVEIAKRSIRALSESITAIHKAPDDLAARAQALRGAMLAGVCLHAVRMGVHHKLAHVLGGLLGLPHAPTHTVLLPHSAAYNRDAAPAAMLALAEALGVEDGPAGLFDLMVSVGAPKRLSALGMSREDTARAAEAATINPYPNPRAIEAKPIESLLMDALYGRRPDRRNRKLALPSAQGKHANIEAVVSGADLINANAVVLAVHGRGATAESITAVVWEALGQRSDVTVVAPQAAGNTWYPKGFMRPLSENAPDLDSALSVLDAALGVIESVVPLDRVVMVGFSQGACLACEFIARRRRPLAGLVSFTGGLLGDAPPSKRPENPQLAPMRVFMGAAIDDPWVPGERVSRTAAWFERCGASVLLQWAPGDQHTITDKEKEALHAMIQTLGSNSRTYLSGLGNAHASEALEGALPRHQNTPHKTPYGLYPEQINGTAFTVRRSENARAWFYRIRPSVMHSPFEAIDAGRFTNDFSGALATPELMRWKPLSMPEAPTDFVQGLNTVGGSGDVTVQDGFAVHIYAANKDMGNKAFYNSDGDMLIAPEHGPLTIQTEYGIMDLVPGEFAVIGRGMRFSVGLPEGEGRGYVLEVYNGHFRLPERGPIGANGLADERHFMVPTASYEDRQPEGGYQLVTKFGGGLFEAKQAHSPFDVVAWHGNYVPYKYDMAHYNAMGSVTFDHPDPSMLTVMTVPRDDHGNAVADVIFFPGRWDVAEHTFRPPYLHRNAAVEFSGIVKGATGTASGYDKGMYSVTPGMTSHAINAESFNRALDASPESTLEPHRLSDDSLWIMFESTMVMKFTPWALEADNRDVDFRRVHKGYRSRFTPDSP